MPAGRAVPDGAVSAGVAFGGGAAWSIVMPGMSGMTAGMRSTGADLAGRGLAPARAGGAGFFTGFGFAGIGIVMPGMAWPNAGAPTPAIATRNAPRLTPVVR